MMETMSRAQWGQPDTTNVVAKFSGANQANIRAHEEAALLREAVCDALTKASAARKGKLSLQQRIAVNRFAIAKEELIDTAQKKSSRDDQCVELMLRTIEKACPLSVLKKISFHHFTVRGADGQRFLLIQALNGSDGLLRELHVRGALNIVKEGIKANGVEYFLVKPHNDVDVNVDGSPAGESDQNFASPDFESEPDLRLETKVPEWNSFRFCLGELPVSRRACLVVHGVATLVRHLHSIGLIRIKEEQTHFDSNLAYSMTAVVEIDE